MRIFRNIIAPRGKTIKDVLIVIRKKYVKPESQAMAKHKWHKLTFDLNTKPLSNFLKEINENAEREGLVTTPIIWLTTYSNQNCHAIQNHQPI